MHPAAVPRRLAARELERVAVCGARSVRSPMAENVVACCRSEIGRTTLNIRKIVTGLNGQGISTVTHDAAVSEVMTLPDIPGWAYATVAQTKSDFRLTGAEDSTPVDIGVAPGETQFALWRLPPVEQGPNPAGMHSTNTVDYVIVISGDVSLVMADGTEVDLHAGDCVVQNGTRHEWINRSRSDCIMAVVAMGVPRV